MSDYPVHTKLSDLISDEESDDDIKTRMNLNLDFSESSSKVIQYRTNLNDDSDSLTDNESDLDSNSKKCAKCVAAEGDSNQESNPHQNLEGSDGKMSKRFGLMFQKGVRVNKAERSKKQASVESGDVETVLPHLKSSKAKIQYAESSFIEVKEDKPKESIKQNNVEASKQGQSLSTSTSTSDDSELGTRADPIGESSDSTMAAAVSEAGLADKNKTLKSDEEEEPPVVEEPEESKPTSYEVHEESASLEQNGNTNFSDEASNDIDHNSTEREIPSSDIKNDDSDQGSEKREKDSGSDVSAKEQIEAKTNSSENNNEDDVKNKRSTKSNNKKDPIGSRATRSSLLRSKTISHSDPSTRKARRESISSDESERSYKPAPPPPKDPIPDASSDFKPYEHWQSLKDSQKADVKNKVTAKQEFAEKYRKHGLPKRAPSLSASYAPKQHHQSLASLASVSTVTVTPGQASRNILKPDFNPFGSPSDKYLTPLQQKEKTIKDMETYIGKLEETIGAQGDQIANFEDEKEEALQYLAADKDAEMDEIFQEMKKLEDEKEEIIEQLKMTEHALEEERESVGNLNDKIAKMEIEAEEREEKHKRNYFQMYQKGREAQLIEQEEDIVCHAMANPGNAPNKQLVHRLEKTEKQLDKLRQTFRAETYKQAPHMESDSEAQVELLKSAVFYYLTDCQPQVNLRTMLSMLNYSEVQKKNIIRHLEKKMK